jgi:hypothetical protein
MAKARAATSDECRIRRRTRGRPELSDALVPLMSLDTAGDMPPANGSSDRGMPGVADVTATRAASPRTATTALRAESQSVAVSTVSQRTGTADHKAGRPRGYPRTPRAVGLRLRGSGWSADLNTHASTLWEQSRGFCHRADVGCSAVSMSEQMLHLLDRHIGVLGRSSNGRTGPNAANMRSEGGVATGRRSAHLRYMRNCGLGEARRLGTHGPGG